MFTSDIGRQIHKKKALVLHHRLVQTVERAYRSAETGLFIRITIPNRLSCGPNQLDGIVDAVKKGLVSGGALVRNSDCRVQVDDFSVSTSPFAVEAVTDLSLLDIREFVRRGWGNNNPNLMTFFSPGNQAMIVLVESDTPDAVLKGVYRQLREACKGQFTKNRPGHLAVQFTDLSGEAMESLARDGVIGSATGLQAMTTDLLSSSGRSYIYSVAYRSHGALGAIGGLPNVLMEQGVVSYTRNPTSPYYNDSRLRLLY